MPGWVTSNEHVISPDGQKALYLIQEKDSVCHALIWSQKGTFSKAGTNILEVDGASLDDLDFKWKSDYKAQISVPQTSTITFQKDTLFLIGDTLLVNVIRR